MAPCMSAEVTSSLVGVLYEKAFTVERHSGTSDLSCITMSGVLMLYGCFQSPSTDRLESRSSDACRQTHAHTCPANTTLVCFCQHLHDYPGSVTEESVSVAVAVRHIDSTHKMR